MRAVCVVALAILAATGAHAQGIDFSQGGAVEVTARGGFEWRENEQVVIATGDARAVRGDVTVLADRLIARYRKKGTGPNGTAPAPAPAAAGTAAAAGSPDSGGNEVYRLEAEQNVRIFTPTDYAQGDHAVYDIDQAVLLMTGHDLKLTTPQQVMTARDSMEYWSQRHIAVGRGHAVVVTTDGRRLAADVLVGYTTDPNAPPTPQTVAAKPAAAPDPGKPADPLMASGKLKRVEAFGNVEVRTQTDIVRGDRGVYVPDTGMARVVGHVRITHGDNQINGPAADVNMKTGIAHLVSDPSQRVQGLLMPNNASDAGLGALTAPAKPARPEGSRTVTDLRVVPGGVLSPYASDASEGLVASGVGKVYKKRPVVRNVSINVRRGEAVGLLGPNGAGKTTTFYMIVGLVRPDTGSIHMDGANITGMPMYRRARLGIGYLPQEASVFRGLNVEQNVMAALELVEPERDRRDQMLDELLAEFGIGHLRRTPALALSGGERRRVEIARALATQPSYILLDEPLAGIDPIAVAEIRDLVSHLKDRGIGVLITDHNVRETLEIIDRAYILHDGQVLMEGRPHEVVAHEGVRRVYLGERFSL